MEARGAQQLFSLPVRRATERDIQRQQLVLTNGLEHINQSVWKRLSRVSDFSREQFPGPERAVGVHLESGHSAGDLPEDERRAPV